jgi:hypothetical protein
MTRRSIGAAAGVLAVVLHAGCRYETIWTGAQFVDSGSVIELAAAEPLCGCLQLTSIASEPVHLRSMMLGDELGALGLAPGEHVQFQFDWGGSRADEVFVIDAWTRDGRQLRAEDVVRIDDTGWPWHACDGRVAAQSLDKTCTDGPLKLISGRSKLW